MKRVATAKSLRRKMGMTQPDFAERFGIPLGTLRDWEQHKSEPDAAARVLLRVIAEAPEVVAAAVKGNS